MAAKYSRRRVEIRPSIFPIGHLSNLSITPPPDRDDDFTLTVTATATEAENADHARTVDTIDVEVTAVADRPVLTVPSTVTVDEDSQSAIFGISSELRDVDGSESLVVNVSDVPVGTTLSDGSALLYGHQ